MCVVASYLPGKIKELRYHHISCENGGFFFFLPFLCPCVPVVMFFRLQTVLFPFQSFVVEGLKIQANPVYTVWLFV